MLRVSSSTSLSYLGAAEIGPTESKEFLDSVSIAASEAATSVVVKGVWSYAAISIAALFADKLFSSLLPRVIFVAGVSYLAARQFDATHSSNG